MRERPFTIIDAEQRSDAWKQARCGLLTGTAAAHMLAKGRGKEESYLRRDLRTRLVTELLTGQPQEEDGNKPHWMQRGVEKEADAFAAYEAAAGVLVRRTGFLVYHGLPIGCSLDGDVDDFTGIIEVKCPKSATHLTNLRDPLIPATYLAQITHNLFVTGAAWCDYASFDDRFPSDLALVIRCVRREDVDLKAYELAMRLFLSEVEAELRAVESLRKERAA